MMGGSIDLAILDWFKCELSSFSFLNLDLDCSAVQSSSEWLPPLSKLSLFSTRVRPPAEKGEKTGWNLAVKLSLFSFLTCRMQNIERINLRLCTLELLVVAWTLLSGKLMAPHLEREWVFGYQVSVTAWSQIFYSQLHLLWQQPYRNPQRNWRAHKGIRFYLQAWTINNCTFLGWSETNWMVWCQWMGGWGMFCCVSGSESKLRWYI